MAPSSTPTWAFLVAVGIVAMVAACVVIAVLLIRRRREQRGFPVSPMGLEPQVKEPGEQE